MSIIGVLVSIILYTVISIWYFLKHLGDKNKPEPWYAIVVLFPVLVIAYTYSVTAKFIKWIRL